MKWLSDIMVRITKLLIFMSALGLVIFGLMTDSSGTVASFSTIFLVFLIVTIFSIYWNSFSNQYKKRDNSTPGVGYEQTTGSQSKTADWSENDNLPNPLDSDIDIPLM
tara:strand:- start:5 stop:328 length:324 start_codon:yes stop_codon:yes gene_type:complete